MRDSSRRKILSEIEQILEMEEKDLGFGVKTKTDCRLNISNRILYKILKALQQEKGLKPSIIYTGNNIVERKELEEMEEKRLEDVELTLN